MTELPDEIPWHTLGLGLWNFAGIIHEDVTSDPQRSAALDQSVAYMTSAAIECGLNLDDQRVLWGYLCGAIHMMSAAGASAGQLASIIAGLWTKLPPEARALTNQQGTNP